MTLYNVGSASKTLGQRCINVIQMFCVCWAGVLSLIVHFTNVRSMLGQRRRRWPNIKTALGEGLVGVVSCNQVTSSTTLYCMLKAYTHASLEPDSIFKQWAM